MRQIWLRLSQLGTQNIHDPLLRKRIVLTNQLSVLIYLVSIVPTLLNHQGVGSAEFLGYMLQIHSFLIPLLFNWQGRTELSKHVFVLILYFVVALMGARDGHGEADVFVSRTYVLVTLGIPFVLFDMDCRTSIGVHVLLGVLLYALTPELHQWLHSEQTNISPQAQDFYHNYAAPFIQIGALLAVFYTTQITDLKLIVGLLNQTRQFNKTLEQQVTDRTAQLAEANHELQTSNAALSQRDEQVTQSLVYAQRIQAAVSKPMLEPELLEFFTYFQPREVVSGDFYYVRRLGHMQLFAAVDCTGHGVPGAFMSMLGVSFLNEILRRGTYQPHRVLEELRQLVKEALQQRGQAGEQKDGMDMALCLIDLQDRTLHFAGAYNPLYCVRRGQLTELKGTRSPIGVHPRELPFETHSLSYQPGDMVYLFTDGFADQLGGPQGDKFKNGQLRTLLVHWADKPLEEQKQALQTAHLRWKGALAQTDDLLVMGIRLS